MLTNQDLQQIAQKGITPEQIDVQLKEFETGFPFLRLEAAASIGHGIVAPNEEERKQYIDAWNAYKAEGRKIVKFVPANGLPFRIKYRFSPKATFKIGWIPWGFILFFVIKLTDSIQYITIFGLHEPVSIQSQFTVIPN